MRPVRCYSSKFYESNWRGKEQTIFLLRRKRPERAAVVAVVDDGHLGCTLPDERINEFDRLHSADEPTDHHHCLVRHIVDGSVRHHVRLRIGDSNYAPGTSLMSA